MKYSKENPPRPEKPGSMDDPIFAAVHLTNMGWCDALGVSQHCSFATASYHATKVMAEIADLRQKLDSATETIKTLEFHLSEAKRDQDAILRLHDGLKHWGVEWSGSSCDAAVTELARMHAIFKAQGERHAKRCEEWAKTADEEREAKESALLQVESLRGKHARLMDLAESVWQSKTLLEAHQHFVKWRDLEVEINNNGGALNRDGPCATPRCGHTKGVHSPSIESGKGVGCTWLGCGCGGYKAEEESEKRLDAPPLCRSCGKPGVGMNGICPVCLVTPRRGKPENVTVICDGCSLPFATAKGGPGRLCAACIVREETEKMNREWGGPGGAITDPMNH